MTDMNRIRSLTLPDGSAPYLFDGRVILTALPQNRTVTIGKPVLVNGADYQDSVGRQFSVTFVGKIDGEDYLELRDFFDDMEAACGLRNRRFYLYDDRFWWVRHEGTRFLFPWTGVRLEFVQIEVYFRMMVPYLYDEDMNRYRFW